MPEIAAEERRLEPRIDATEAARLFADWLAEKSGGPAPAIAELRLMPTEFRLCRARARVTGRWQAEVGSPAGTETALALRRHEIRVAEWERSGRRGAPPRAPALALHYQARSGGIDEEVALDWTEDDDDASTEVAGLASTALWRHWDAAAPVAPTGTFPDVAARVEDEVRARLATTLAGETGRVRNLRIDTDSAVTAAEMLRVPAWLVRAPAPSGWRQGLVDAVTGEVVGATASRARGRRRAYELLWLGALAVLVTVQQLWVRAPDWFDSQSPVVDESIAAPVAIGDPSSWIDWRDYPGAALRENRQGVTTITWDVDTRGRAVNCRTVASSGWADLDRAACAAIERRGRYRIPKNAKGPVLQTATRRVRWEIPED